MSAVAAIAAVVPMMAAVVGAAGPAAAATSPAYRHACAAAAPPGRAECLVLVPVNARAAARGASPLLSSAGYKPTDLQKAYNLLKASATSGRGQTVALVDAFDDPNAAADLSHYRSMFHLPACTVANKCFRKVNQNGKTSPLPAPSGSTGWATEESLDLDMVSAVCPNCHIILVETNDNSLSNLGQGVNAAVSLGARFVSNSYGGGEFSGETSADPDYHHPGVAVTASAGDNGFGVQYPAASPFVTSVGGTSLHRDSSVHRGWRESVWGDGLSGLDQGTGSGCSAFESKPSWQTDSGCGNRTVSDVSAVADPSTGVWIYDTYDQGGWLVVGGTSAASPIIASVYALAGRPGSSAIPAQYAYLHTNKLNDVTSGSNGTCGTYLCNAGVGYDGPTGLGTPIGTAAFKAVDNTITITSPGARISVKGKKINPLQIHAVDSLSSQSLRFTATGLPAGLSISTSGKITGTPKKLQYTKVTVSAADNTGVSASVSFFWDDSARGTITSGLSAKRCLTARRGSVKAGNAIEIAQCNGTGSQRWIIYAGPKGQDSVELASGVKSNTNHVGCMGVKGSSTASGAKAATFTCTLSGSMLWKPGGSGHLVGVHSGKCLTDPKSGKNGTQLVITKCATANRERWKLP